MVGISQAKHLVVIVSYFTYS